MKKSIQAPSRPGIWWSNSLFFLGCHLAAIVGIYYHPLWLAKTPTLILTFVAWQGGELGITLGYHRLYSHRAYQATLGVRIVLALMGASAFQGSIKRFTDDEIHDPYAATRGLFFSHMGWIFFRPKYERMKGVADDLNDDIVVRYQHKYYVPLAIFCGFVLPTLLGSIWGDSRGAFVWGALFARIAIWHCTFLINSFLKLRLAHWKGLQPYSDENTSRGNLILAILTAGEGNHNFHHAFPYDFRSGPNTTDWDPSKWMIQLLHLLGLAYNLRQASADNIDNAIKRMGSKESSRHPPLSHALVEMPLWSQRDLGEYLNSHPLDTLLLLDGYIVDVTSYLESHPGGENIMQRYSIKANHKAYVDAFEAFNGGIKMHSQNAKRTMEGFRIASVRASAE